MTAYYNEHDPKAAAWLRELIATGLITDGEVDERSIEDVAPGDLVGFDRCHFFAGIGGWDYALQLAGWDGPVWTGSCPCQPFSPAATIRGRRGFSDERHLWPVWRELIKEQRPPTVFGEQSASAIDWLRLVRSDLDSMGYAVGCAPIEASCVGADHARDRFWFVADLDGDWKPVLAFNAEVASTPLFASNADSQRLQRWSQAGAHCKDEVRAPERWRDRSSYSPEIDLRRHRAYRPLLGRGVHGVPGRVDAVRGYGNAIVPQVAEAFIRAYQDVRRANA